MSYKFVFNGNFADLGECLKVCRMTNYEFMLFNGCVFFVTSSDFQITKLEFKDLY